MTVDTIGCLSDTWLHLLREEFVQPYYASLATFLMTETQAGKVIYPQKKHIFNALNRTAFEDVKVVIIGQDPYHGANQAHGLSFSVPSGVDLPPSLKNIYKELNADLGMVAPQHGCLASWADQGVLLLNAVLTVEQSKAGAHQGKGWEQFTDRIVQLLNEQRESIVFILWGGYAQKKGQIIDCERHCVIKTPHPSPLSAYRGFFGSCVFTQSNTYLQSTGQAPIAWDSIMNESSAQLTMSFDSI